MSTAVKVSEKRKRSWRDVLRAFGRAHRKASVQMESSAPLLKHLDELRIRIFKAFLALIITTGVSFVFSQQIIEYLATPIGGTSKRTPSASIVTFIFAANSVSARIAEIAVSR